MSKHCPPQPQRTAPPHHAGSWLPVLLLAACLCTATSWAVTATPAPVAQGRAEPGPRLMSPDAVRDSATAPGSMRLRREALPQLTLPLGVPPVEPAASAPGVLPAKPAAGVGGTSDAVAQCEARRSALERRQCRRQLARQLPVTR